MSEMHSVKIFSSDPFVLQKQGFIASPAHQAHTKMQQQQHMTKSQQAMVKLFSKYDVAETSYHLYTGRIDLHLCDDMTPGEWCFFYHTDNSYFLYVNSPY